MSTQYRVLFVKLTVTYLVKTFPGFYGTRRSITVFTKANHCSLSWARWVQSTIFHIISLTSIPILSSQARLCHQSGFIPSGFRTKTIYEFLISTIHATCHTDLILDLDSLMMFGETYKLCSSSFCLLQPPNTSSHRSRYSSQHRLLRHPHSIFFP
jgi:hypothetical protein